MKIEIISAEYHRNGVSGVGFFLTRFSWEETSRSGELEMGTNMAVVFDKAEYPKGDIGNQYVESCVAVFDPLDITACMRGDHFDDDLRKAVRKFADAKWAAKQKEWKKADKKSNRATAEVKK